MSIEQRLELAVHEHFYQLLVSDEAVGAPTSIGTNGVFAATDGGLTVWTGTDTGPLDLKVGVFDEQPAPQNGSFTDVVETSVESTQGRLYFGNAMIGVLTPVEVPSFGWLRLRVHVAGRDAARTAGVVLDSPIEQHYWQVWAAPQAADRVVRFGDQTGNAFGRSTE